MQADLETITSLAKRRGFVFPSAEIYGGFAAAYDYGPLGVELKRNIRDRWWRAMVQERDDVVGLEAAIITNPAVWVASGHVAEFTDPLVECLSCQGRFRADHVEANTCPNCGTVGKFSEPRKFNMMLSTIVGPVADESGRAFMRPETAQGMFVNFDNVQTTTRKRLPFGVAQIGKSFRNEITVKQFIFRTREFEQMEMEYFCHPATSLETHAYWKKERLRWYYSLGIRPQHLRLRDHRPDELSHYSKATADIEVHYPWGWGEVEGIAHRGAYDLTQHATHSGKRLTYFDPDTNEHLVPHVVEPAAGVDRIMLTLMLEAYEEQHLDGGDSRVVMHFAPAIAPVTVAILPLSRKDTLEPTARRIWEMLRPTFRTQYDDAQSIGRRYRRQDEIGTPLCVTVDFETLTDDAVTIRERDTMAQIRVPIAGLIGALQGRLAALEPRVPSLDEIEV
ncbi:MAG: glycine--tRNA ligase [Dehalococcoidia bacterium]|nr:glycine--tRNA ligase [Dehalococcoidia bacterium]